MASSPAASLFSAPVRPAPPVRVVVASSVPRNVSSAGVSPSGYGFTIVRSVECHRTNTNRIVAKAFAVATNTAEETKECVLPTWAEFDIGRAAVFWKTTNGFPPTSGEMLKLFYNPAASNLVPNDDFGVAFNGGFNQPIMCGGEPRTMTMKNRGKADPPIYSIQIRVPEHATNLMFSFTNGTDWDGPYKLQFQVPKKWKNKPISFFNEGLAEELSKEGACEQAIFPDSQVVVNRCSIANLSAEGSDRCNLDLVPGCMDPDSHLYNPLANVDDGTCPIDV